ncbi:hypothetical protein O6H91_12G065400 [Diphasiastrum complanatum]|uniref:Uncharacterized protein n=6 Tax=Diphasiastrum complanatum TaxID=34168 RepID=A0ACC2C2N9_DIPCM|nr:hypothetical protein O6H91_12G065400 [Diphasiastrum complanatum]KAJ7536338.1 hypothetical protein O6H91_12G065400 [Diphasiastrum complanatum]KAJ7536339.1 hypothetical protein O6H91_12G065400 [Diphasiastrum complanatum]KAJ7536340.1 hypothetical protein O6H91_12G065400 [Diphasiastrum complanatum]KAJ7536341.1 hypothetical protein O6H91_12G065400 [Diphasiastrum complanatum]
MEVVARTIGVSVPVLRFLISFAATIPCGWVWRFMPGPTARHAYAAFSGAHLSYFAFGMRANLLFSFLMIVGYGSMLLHRRSCGLVTFVAAFAFLISCHVHFMSGEAWKEGGIDCTGALMVLTLKVVSCSINYQDGLLKEEGLREAQKRNRLLHIPSPLAYIGYCLCFGTHFAGPVYEIRDYIDWTEETGLWSISSQKPPPAPYWGTIAALARTILCMGVYLFLSRHVPLALIFESQFKTWPLWRRWAYVCLCGFTARWKYYFIWSMSEACMIVAGLGFSGWSNKDPSKPKWDRARNVDILAVELAGSAGELPLHWNIHVSTWLRFYVYERLISRGKKPGFLQLLATQVVSAVWHGLYAGYLLFFINSAIMIAGSRVIYKWQRAIPESWGLIRRAGWFIHFLYTSLVLNYACIGFLVLTTRETLEAYNRLYYAGTILPIAITALGYVIHPPRPVTSRSKRD